MTAFGFVDYIAVLKEWSAKETRHREVRRVLDLVNLGIAPASASEHCPEVSGDGSRWPRGLHR